MKTKSSINRPLINKADLNKISDAVNNTATTEDVYRKAFSEKECSLAMYINGMLAEYIDSDSEAVRRAYGKKITKTLNEMYSIYMKYDDDPTVAFSPSDDMPALSALLRFADKIKVLRLLHIPKFNDKSRDVIITFRVYIARIGICWCRIRKSHHKNGMCVITRFTN